MRNLQRVKDILAFVMENQIVIHTHLQLRKNGLHTTDADPKILAIVDVMSQHYTVHGDYLLKIEDIEKYIE